VLFSDCICVGFSELGGEMSSLLTVPHNSEHSSVNLAFPDEVIDCKMQVQHASIYSVFLMLQGFVL
jgi:hypothetical protein